MKRILVVRNDRIGDFMLAWPALALLGQSEHCEVSVLVPQYTEELAHMCPWVSHVVIDPGARAPFVEQQKMVEDIKALKLDGAIALFSNWRNAVTLRHAEIPYRLAPATKFAQILYTHKVFQQRSRSLKPEWQYNLDLAAKCLEDFGLPVGHVSAPYLVDNEQARLAARQQIAQALKVQSRAPWLIVHPGSGGSAVNLSAPQYALLIRMLAKALPDWQILLSAGPDEVADAQTMADVLRSHEVRVGVLSPEQGLSGLVHALANADLMIAGSTGPLHIAGALNRPTVGFFPARRSATALRWQPVSSLARHLAIQADKDRGSKSFENLDLDAVCEQILSHVRAQSLLVDLPQSFPDAQKSDHEHSAG